jgi:hypothetical protein
MPKVDAGRSLGRRQGEELLARRGGGHVGVTGMYRHEGGSELVELIERQFELVLDRAEPRDLLFRLVRLLDVLQREPTISSLLGDAEFEARESLAEYADSDRRFQVELLELVDASADWLRTRWPVAGAHDEFQGHRSLDAFRERLAAEHEVDIHGWALPSGDVGAAGPAIQDFLYILEDAPASGEEGADAGEGSPMADLFLNVQRIKLRRLHHWRSFRMLLSSHGGFAVQRLRHAARAVNPAPVLASMDDAGPSEWAIAYDGETEVAGKVFVGAAVEKQSKLARLLDQVRHDLPLVREDLRFRIGIGRSRIGLLRRFAARCERYDADRLRRMCKRFSRTAERSLTLEFARFMFEEGFNPFVDPSVGRLRPDVLDPHLGLPIYVEAKQYSIARGLRADASKWVRQVLDTWGALRQEYEVPEAFLLVFRVTGPRLELPETLPVHGRRLRIVVVDVAEARVSGSRQKSSPIVLSVEELLSGTR